jgi:hypothetical protein
MNLTVTPTLTPFEKVSVDRSVSSRLPFDPFTLEQATNLTSPILWAPVEATRQTQQGRHRVDLQLGDAQFFRLRKP